MTLLYLIVGLIALQRLAESCYARYNTKRLLAAGAHEVGAGHYPLLIALHAGWLAATAIVADPAASPNLALLSFYGFLQLLRAWVLLSLGRYWTTRVIVVSRVPLVAHGLYRYIRHPNYLIVCAEIATLPLIFGAWPVSLAFSILNGALLLHRVGIEDRALAVKRTLSRSGGQR